MQEVFVVCSAIGELGKAFFLAETATIILLFLFLNLETEKKTLCGAHYRPKLLQGNCE